MSKTQPVKFWEMSWLFVSINPRWQQRAQKGTGLRCAEPSHISTFVRRPENECWPCRFWPSELTQQGPWHQPGVGAEIADLQHLYIPKQPPAGTFTCIHILDIVFKVVPTTSWRSENICQRLMENRWTSSASLISFQLNSQPRRHLLEI